MSEKLTQKTLPTDQPVDEFLDNAATARRIREGHELLALFTEASGKEAVMWGSSMVGFGQYNYQSPANPRTKGIWPKVAFSPRKAKISLYGLKDLPEGKKLLPQLGKYTEGMGCVYVNKLEDIDLNVLRQLIAIAMTFPDQW
ncbi:DUF1801 domain-containing protein [uncultured Rothia sp.]|uniref:DUF1801 domain-containing protein n=1 Tax=uncultured Rothia sp. TaxID=316088 RepID=UPI00321686E7